MADVWNLGSPDERFSDYGAGLRVWGPGIGVLGMFMMITISDFLKTGRPFYLLDPTE